MRGILFLLICGGAFLNMATTYIVRENGQEVGRWVEADGNEITRYIDNDSSSNQARYYDNESEAEWDVKRLKAKEEAEERFQKLLAEAGAPLKDG